VAIRHIGQVVTDVLCGARDPDGDAVFGQKSGAGDEMPLGADSRSSSRMKYRRVIRLQGWAPAAPIELSGPHCGRCWGRSSISGPRLDYQIRYHMRAMRKWRQQTSGLVRPTPGVASGTRICYFGFTC
jgi:hypothetical protein